MTTKNGFPIIYLIEGEPSKWNSKPCSGQRIGHPISAYQPYFMKQNRKWLNGTVGNLCIAINTAGKEYMGKKDLAGKDFFADRRRFAELFNAILYQGEDIIRAEELERVIRIYPSLSGKGEMSRDVFMKDAKRNVCYGLELETESDYGMPERVMVYDACELEQQIKEISEQHKKEFRDGDKLVYREKKSRMKETDFLLPVVTVVLYLGTYHWEGKQKLSELYCIPEELQKSLGQKLPDYGFTMAEADYINPNSFKTDLREFFQAMQCRNDKEKLRELLNTQSFKKLSKEAGWAIIVHLDRKQLTEKVEKEGLDMCKALKEMLEDERKEGEILERLAIIKNLIREGVDQEFIRRVTGCSQEEFASAANG